VPLGAVEEDPAIAEGLHAGDRVLGRPQIVGAAAEAGVPDLPRQRNRVWLMGFSGFETARGGI
jgi:hypothetical protein